MPLRKHQLSHLLISKFVNCFVIYLFDCEIDLADYFLTNTQVEFWNSEDFALQQAAESQIGRYCT